MGQTPFKVRKLVPSIFSLEVKIFCCDMLWLYFCELGKMEWR